MKWQIKALIQNLISLLPTVISTKVYFYIQKKFGRLQSIEYLITTRLVAAVSIWEKIQKSNKDPVNKSFYELGSGKTPILPISLWLMGAKNIISIDKESYFNETLFFEFIDYLKENKKKINYLLNNRIDNSRFEKLYEINFSKKTSIKRQIKEYFNIDLISTEKKGINLNNKYSVDFYISYSVLEHINKKIMDKILYESFFMLKNDGLQIHFIDYSDHYAQTDKSISRFNFYKYSDFFWTIYSSNMFTYVNRFRHDDFLSFFKDNNLKIIDEETFIDKRFENFLEHNKIYKRFILKDNKILSILSAWIVLEKNV